MICFADRVSWLMAGSLLLATAVPGLLAQDAAMSPVQWSETRDAPDELPALRRVPRVEFPDELRSTPDYGYVAFDMVLDEKGKMLALIPHATLAAYERVATLSFYGLRWNPAQRTGKGVNSVVMFAVVFNPAAAAEKSPDAAPRLLEVAVARRPQPKDTRRGIPDEVVFGDVSIDEQGRVTEVKNVPAECARACEIAAKNFHFVPARRAGQPVAATARVPFVVETGTPILGEGRQVPPAVIDQPGPLYPRAMRATGMRGEVLVDFVVDIEGRVRNAFVVKSLNPAFDDPALDAVRKWRFRPAHKGDLPVPAHMQVPVVFVLDAERGGGDDGIEITKKGDLSKLPEQFRYDTPPKLRSMVRPVFPYALLAAGKTGRAAVTFIVGPTGRVLQATVQTASAPEFGQALLAAVEQFTYEPALKGGRPGLALLSFAQEFSRDEGWQLVGDGDLDALRREQKKPQTIVTTRELDAKLTPVSQRPLHYPLAQTNAASDQGEAVVEFLVDEEGRVRLPRIVSATDDAFGYAAVQGVSAWRFEEPKRGGRSVVVRVQAPIVFKRDTKR
jgi:TonB family protein